MNQMNISRSAIFFTVVILVFSAEVRAQRSGGGAIMAIDEPSEVTGAARSGGGSVGAADTVPEVRRAAVQRSSSPATRRLSAKSRNTPKRNAAPKPWNGFTVGDKYTFLNFEVVSAAKPYHTRAAKASGASGLVQVEILIDENGNVMKAKARTGNELLHPEAERAALESKFNKPGVYGKPARAVGFLVYRFGPDDGD